MLVALLVASQFLIGNWVPAMMTVYLVTGATIICVLIGVPLGVWCSRSERVASVVDGDLRHAADLPELHLSHPGDHAA